MKYYMFHRLDIWKVFTFMQIKEFNTICYAYTPLNILQINNSRFEVCCVSILHSETLILVSRAVIAAQIPLV